MAVQEAAVPWVTLPMVQLAEAKPTIMSLEVLDEGKEISTRYLTVEPSPWSVSPVRAQPQPLPTVTVLAVW